MKIIESDSGARLEAVARSAFRVLGVAASASQAEVFEAAEALRLAARLGVEKRFDSDLAWLGPLARTEADLRDALGRLSDPPRRAAERLFWFHQLQDAARPATITDLRRRAEALAGGGPAARHDAALLLLAALHALDPHFGEPAAWAQSFGLWRETVEGEEFWSLLVAADLKGEFEQALTFGEAAALREETPRLVSKAVAAAAARAAVAEDFALAGRALSVLRAARLPRPLLDEYENEILAPFEERAEHASDMAFARVRLYKDVESFLPSERKRMYDGSLYEFDRDVRGELRKLLKADGPEGFHLGRALRHAAGWLNELAGSYREEGWPEQAAYVYREALAVAPPGSAALAEAEAALRELGAEAAAHNEEEFAAGLAGRLSQRPPPPKLFENPVAPARKDRTFVGCLAQAAFCVLVVVACFASDRCGILKTSRSTRYTPGAYNFNSFNFNIAVPQFSPVPMPSLMQYSSVPLVTADELRRKMRGGRVVVVDVRGREEFEAGHVAGALSVPRDEAEGRAATLRRGGRQVVCYGSAANPWAAQIVALTLRIEGLTNVAILDGGFEAWAAAGLPTEPPAAPPNPPADAP